MPQVSCRFHEQLQVGSELLLATLWLATELLLAGGCFALEHPIDSKREGHMPIWSLPIFDRFKQSPAVQFLDFDQCVTEQAIVGPTTLMLVRLPEVATAIKKRGHHGRCNHGYGAHTSSRGKN